MTFDIFRAKRWWLGWGFLLVLLTCSRQPESQEPVIAHVGQEIITLSQFRRFYELDPNFAVDSTGFQALRDELWNYIDSYLTYLRAQRDGLLQDSLFVRALRWEQRQAILRQLYREVVSKQIQISEDDLRREYFAANVAVHVKHLFTPDSLQAGEWYRALLQGASWDSLARLAFRDTILARNGGDLGWHKIWDLDEAIGNAALTLSLSQISSPVRSRWGFHIIQLLNRRDQMVLRESEFNRQKPLLEKRIRQRRSQEIAHRYIAHYLGTLNPQPVPETFALMWETMTRQVESSGTLKAPLLFTNELIDLLHARLANHLNDPLIRYRGGTISLGEFLNAQKKIPVSNRPRFRTPRQLSNKMGKWVRDEFLLKEAYRKGIENHPRVKREVREFALEQTYLYYLKQKYQEVEVPDSVRAFFQHSSAKRNAPVGLRRFHTVNEWRWEQARRRLHRELQQQAPPVQIDRELLRRESKQMDWQRRIRMFVIRQPE